MPDEGFALPGSKTCLGCRGTTFRNRQDGLCPRCAYQAEDLIEQIELECLAADLALITQFEAYCQQRDEATRVASRSAFGKAHPLFDPSRLREQPFGVGTHGWEHRRTA